MLSEKRQFKNAANPETYMNLHNKDLEGLHFFVGLPQKKCRYG